jgi:hypothetical protein
MFGSVFVLLILPVLIVVSSLVVYRLSGDADRRN